MKQDLILTAKSMDWVELPNQKNPVMISFTNENGTRINVYFTTMTVTVQSAGADCLTYRNVTPREFEDILSKHY